MDHIGITGPEDDEKRLSLREKELIRMYRGLDTGRKKCIEDTLSYLAERCDENEQ